METTDEEQRKAAALKRLLLILSCILLSIGNCGGPLIMRLYFIHGGKRVWLSSMLETGGWPIILVPIAIAYYHRLKNQAPTEPPTKLFLMNHRQIHESMYELYFCVFYLVDFVNKVLQSRHFEGKATIGIKCFTFGAAKSI